MSRWIDTELLEQDMGDKRLNKRAKALLENLSRDASLSIPNANQTWAETQAAYRFFDNEKVTFDSIMSGHQSAMIKRVQNEPVVLVLQDTTFLNFATDDKSKRMGTLRMKKSDQQLLHASITITPSRVNLGVVGGSLCQREDKNKTVKLRLGIEMDFRVLKGSYDIEKNRFRSEPRMFKCIAIYMIIS